jgi:hypothetical protein
VLDCGDDKIASSAFSRWLMRGASYLDKSAEGIWLGAFLGGVGNDDYRTIAGARCLCHAQVTGICLGDTLHKTH